MLNGKVAPEMIRVAMKDRFLGCDECQACCPMNPDADGEPNERLPLKELLNGTMIPEERLGRNLAIRNRVLAQACLNAGCPETGVYTEELRRLAESPSETVRTYARWALEKSGIDMTREQ